MWVDHMLKTLSADCYVPVTANKQYSCYDSVRYAAMADMPIRDEMIREVPLFKVPTTVCHEIFIICRLLLVPGRSGCRYRVRLDATFIRSGLTLSRSVPLMLCVVRLRCLLLHRHYARVTTPPQNETQALAAGMPGLPMTTSRMDKELRTVHRARKRREGTN